MGLLIGIGHWNLGFGLGIRIGNWRLRLGIGDLEYESGLGYLIRMGIGIVVWDWALEL